MFTKKNLNWIKIRISTTIVLHQHLHNQDQQQHHKLQSACTSMCTACTNRLILTVPPHISAHTINIVLIHTMTLSPTIFYICSPACTHAHPVPILVCVNVRRASWFISWVVSHENRGAFQAEVNTRVERKRQACLWMSVTHCQTTLDHLSSFKEAATVGTARGLGWIFIIFPCKPSRGLCFKGGTWRFVGSIDQAAPRALGTACW